MRLMLRLMPKRNEGKKIRLKSDELGTLFYKLALNSLKHIPEYKKKLAEDLEKNPELKDAVNNFTLFYGMRESNKNIAIYWSMLGELAEAVKWYTAKGDPVYEGVGFYGYFLDKIKGIMPYWNSTPEEIKTEMVGIIKKAYGKDQKIVEEVLMYLQDDERGY